MAQKDSGSIKKKLDEQKYRVLKTSTKTKYSYYWKAIALNLDYFLINCNPQFHYLEFMVSSTQSFIPLEVKGKISGTEIEHDLLKQIISALE